MEGFRPTAIKVRLKIIAIKENLWEAFIPLNN